jgi:uncharacterized paraquat-inducible protein A
MKLEDQEEPIVYKVQLLEELAQKQERLLLIANEIIDGKNRIIELCELEIELHRRENLRLQRALFICGIVLLISATLNLIRLFS